MKASLAMPDIHLGYGIPIGGVVAFDEGDGVISPGGIGFDINCGVRLLASRLKRQDVVPHAVRLTGELFHRIPTGIGATGALSVSREELRKVARSGAHWAVENKYGYLVELGQEGAIRLIVYPGRESEGVCPEKVSRLAYSTGHARKRSRFASSL